MHSICIGQRFKVTQEGECFFQIKNKIGAHGRWTDVQKQNRMAKENV